MHTVRYALMERNNTPVAHCGFMVTRNYHWRLTMPNWSPIALVLCTYRGGKKRAMSVMAAATTMPLSPTHDIIVGSTGSHPSKQIIPHHQFCATRRWRECQFLLPHGTSPILKFVLAMQSTWSNNLAQVACVCGCLPCIFTITGGAV